MVVNIGTAHKVPQQQCDRHHERHDGGGDIGEGNIALGDVHDGTGLARTRGGQGLADAHSNGSGNLQQGPYGGNGHGAHADEADVIGEGGIDDVGKRGGARNIAGGENGQQDEVGNHHANQHGNAYRQAHQVADADKGSRKACAQGGRAGAELEIGGDLGGGGLHCGQQRHDGRGDTAGDDDAQTLGIFFVAGAGSILIAHLEDLGRGHALRVGQIGAGHQSATQRDGIHHAQHAADDAHAGRLHEAKALPVPHHHQAWEDKDDGGQGARGRGNGLHDVVFFNVVALEPAQHRHGNHGGRDGGSKGQAHLQA